ncbi:MULTISPECIES: site-specific integrase [Pseudomonas]|uniref:site-specific integrase n=1 Tax=Pseudomonas TaxID=286 RepID=UPI001FCD69D1|nr:site-specific integrase [Pseudomonas marincola]
MRAVKDLHEISRSRVLVWRANLESAGLSSATSRRKLAALASLFDYLIERGPRHTRNPVHGIRRPRIESYVGKTPALNNAQEKLLLNAPDRY